MKMNSGCHSSKWLMAREGNAKTDSWGIVPLTYLWPRLRKRGNARNYHEHTRIGEAVTNKGRCGFLRSSRRRGKAQHALINGLNASSVVYMQNRRQHALVNWFNDSRQNRFRPECCVTVLRESCGVDPRKTSVLLRHRVGLRALVTWNNRL